MTDSEWIANIHNFSNAEIFEQLEQIGCDGYYRDIWSACIEELRRRVNLTSGDLISREALKDKLTDTINVNDITKSEWYEGYAACVQVLSELIDSAQAVETYTKDDMTREYLKGYNACKDMNERPQGDLISREALKKAVFNGTFDTRSKILSLIDNAPTVSIDWGTDGGDRTVYARPKGKWKSKIIEVKKHYAECPFCGFSFEETSGRILPYFCGACDADLREDDEE